ncbi:molybdopterin-dependent oxidoreductase [Lentibacillus amyloliquefaciens]|uniref:Biotin transporter BioY n=1 Tax=Lentibacillus amyloliquefaciens TaxID=1472767 RepID=A0A0U4FFT8_9BACI|nr:molybdopterin-dependent oxidoreductase [Lentibacillus amyloliquefaciens]ALX47534.1 hypothetical protein AOX59_02290 [Lentibacillus amyloliquefaciens]
MQKNKKAMVGTHWGIYQVETSDGAVVDVQPARTDSNPSPIGELLYDVMDNRFRIAQPMVRAGYLRGDQNHRQSRGKEPFVPVSWEEALELAASALKDTKEKVGNAGIYGGSYGWGSAGRFHHAQSQVHRFLNTIGGYVASANNYSAAACQVIVPHVIGVDYGTADDVVEYGEIIENCDLLIAFGGLNQYNNQVKPGGVTDHHERNVIEEIAASGTEVISVSPIQSDIPRDVAAEWIAARPCSDVAIMLGIAHYLEVNNKVDVRFIDRYTVGYDKFKAYLLGQSDGVMKDPEWASSIANIPSQDIIRLAEKLANARCPLITVSLSLQRSEHGEQPFWLAIVLAAMLGSIGKKGGGFGLRWGSSNGSGYYHKTPFSWGGLSQGWNPIKQTIPVARIADMLLNPGSPYSYNGENRTYPDIQLIYWAGGNPFHHHQDLNQLRRAWRKPKTVIVHDSTWTATARHADIVFPANTFLERNDVICSKDDYHITPSKKVLENYGQSRTDYEIFCGLAERLGVLEAFSEGRDETAWLKNIYKVSRNNAKQAGAELIPFDEFWETGEPLYAEPKMKPRRNNFMSRFLNDPKAHPLSTPSGKIEIFSSRIASFKYADCTGHPRWFDKNEWLGAPRASSFPLHMISHQPRNKLHSQLDFGAFSHKDKTAGRETVTINPADACKRGITDGMLVRVFNDRGACLTGARLSDDIMQGVVSLPTGAWYCPDDTEGPNSLEYHGNPNVLTADKGTSSLAQGPTAHSCLVEIEPFHGSAPEVQELLMPKFISRADV